MNIQSIQEQYQLIAQLLESKRLGEALTQLDAFLQSGGNWQLSNKLEQIKLSYQYMLQYMKQGTTDPERHKVIPTTIDRNLGNSRPDTPDPAG